SSRRHRARAPAASGASGSRTRSGRLWPTSWRTWRTAICGVRTRSRRWRERCERVSPRRLRRFAGEALLRWSGGWAQEITVIGEAQVSRVTRRGRCTESESAAARRLSDEDKHSSKSRKRLHVGQRVRELLASI